MEIRQFSEKWLVKKVDGLPRPLKVLLAAIAAERGCRRDIGELLADKEDVATLGAGGI
jgi:hypothetical protein